MKSVWRKLSTALMAVLFVIVQPLIAVGPNGLYTGEGTAYANVGSVAEGEDVIYDKEGGILKSLGFDTSKMPEGYDPDTTGNPYGADVNNLKEVEEVVRLQTGGDPKSDLYGHNAKLDGAYETLQDSKTSNPLHFLTNVSFLHVAKCDVTGDGRDGGLAIVYTEFDHADDSASEATDRNIYLRIYDVKGGTISDPFTIATFPGKDDKHLIMDYLIQSQMQVTAGDYDKDAVDEIAVYCPAMSEQGRSKVEVYDLTEGKDCENPFSKASWRNAWNYILPQSQAEVVNTGRGTPSHPEYMKNVYNNLDLTSGDADNDGICDLIVTYGASDTNYTEMIVGYENQIQRSIPSKSVLLYGSDQGQMLKDTQKLDYGDDALIRVSFAYGDADGDGNEDLFLGGQLQSEQGDNTSRVLGKYIYSGDDGMQLQTIKNMQVVSGTTTEDGKFYSSNGWDGEYHSTPLMKSNLAIGNVCGAESNAKVYLDSVLYSYDGNDFAIVDELEDPSPDDSGDEAKGSQIFTDFKGYYNHENLQASYFEYGADSGDFTGGLSDYMTVNRMSIREKDNTSENCKEYAASLIVQQDTDDDTGLVAHQVTNHADDPFEASRYFISTTDTDKDSMIATYTGEHKVVYQKPKVLAVLASAPYFQDVADYDEGDMLNWCNTAYAESNGKTTGWESSYSSQFGLFANFQIGTKAWRFMANVGAGWCREETWGDEYEEEFELSYDTAGGEDAVVMYSIPSENFRYKVEAVSVDDDGVPTVFKQDLLVSKFHNPVTQVLKLDDYMEIQKSNPDPIPDVTKYLGSTPGRPKTYPTSETDIPKAAKDNLVKSGTRTGDKWSGIAYGSGTETQTLTYNHSHRDRYKNALNGGYGSIEIGGTTEEDFLIFSQFEAGGHFEFEQMTGNVNVVLDGTTCSGTVSNMPSGAKGYGYDFAWRLFKYEVKDDGNKFPVITYMLDGVTQPPSLPENISQDFEKTTDSQVSFVWDYNAGDPKEFQIYRYEDFPQGGGDKLIGTVSGTDYKIKKDDNGNTIKDKNGVPIKEYRFDDVDLTPDTKYQYRMKVIGKTNPKESIFSPVFEGRTFVGTKPDISLSADKLTIYPDATYEVECQLADPEHYQKEISYQWQIYDKKTRKWADMKGRDKQKLAFYNCMKQDEGKYRCRVNLIRKTESHPQYITAYTDPCTVEFSLRDVTFGDITVFPGSGEAETNTGLAVGLYNSSQTSLERPTGTVTFTLTGPNGSFQVMAGIEERTGLAKIDSIEDKIGMLGQQSFVDGGYLITAEYDGSAIFYPADDPEQYHYLRNISECMFLSVKSEYDFGEDVAETARLLDYKKDKTGKITCDEYTDEITEFRFYAVDGNGLKTGDPVATCKLSETDGKALVPLDARLAKKAWVEAYREGSDEPAAGYAFVTRKIVVELKMNEKLTGTGDLLEFVSSKDLTLSNGIDVEEKNIVTTGGKKSLADYLLFKYYEQNGDFMYDSSTVEQHKDEFIPAEYAVRVALQPGIVDTFYKPTFKGAKLTVVGNYYLVSASAKDPNTGSVGMISPDSYKDFEKIGYPGGTKLTLKALPDKGFTVTKWIVDECGENQYTLPGAEKIDYTVKSQNTAGTGEIKIRAVMSPKNNTLEYSAKGQGRVTLKQPIQSGDTVLADTRLDFTATPESGWKFDEWRWVNTGGDNVVSGGVPMEDGTNTKTFTMPDNSAVLYGVFKRDTINIAVPKGIVVQYVNDGSDPLREIGEIIDTDKGRNVPKGVQVIVKTAPGTVLAPGSAWDVKATTPAGIQDLPYTELVSEGQQGCTFQLPQDVTGCTVAVETAKGRYAVEAYGDDVEYTIYVDGDKMDGTTVNDVEAGSQVDVKAKPERGKLIEKWIVNGEELETTEGTYTNLITGNLSVTCTTKDDEKVKLSLATEGGGTAKYVITDKNEETVEGTFQGESTDVDAYKGESAVFSIADGDTEHTLTAVVVDGEQVDIEDGAFELKDIAKDTEVLLRFRPNTYYDVQFKNGCRTEKPLILDEDGYQTDITEPVKVPKNGSLSFSVVMHYGYNCTVRANGEKIASTAQTDYGDDRVKYDYEIANIDEKKEVVVSDHDTIYIYDQGDLYDYFDELYNNEPAVQPDGELMADIKVFQSAPLMTPYENASTFNGNGHTLFGLAVGEPNNYAKNFYGLFGSLTEKGSINDLLLMSAFVYAKTPTVNSVDGYAGMLTYNNYGTIRNVEVMNCEFHVDHGADYKGPAGVLAYDNHGLIENCIVRGVLIEGDNEELKLGAGGVVYNQFKNIPGDGLMKNVYIEDFQIQPQGEDQKPAEHNITAMGTGVYEDTSRGTFTNVYYKAPYSAEDVHGAAVYTLTAHPDDEEQAVAEAATPEFVRKLAYTLNAGEEKKPYGTGGKDDNVMMLTALSQTAVPPIKVDFKAGAKTVTKYFYPGSNELPGRDEFGDDTPAAWLVGDNAYAPGKSVELWEDDVIEGTGEISDYTASLSDLDDQGQPVNTTYFKTLKEAMQEDTASVAMLGRELKILKDCEMEGFEYVLGARSKLTVAENVKFTMKADAQITTAGQISFETGSELHKYGTIVNSGLITVPENTFYNYGSKLDNTAGTIVGQTNIICRPHIHGEWTYADAPEADGRWKKTSTCSICTTEIEEYVEPNPPVNRITDIEIFQEADTIDFEVGEGFTHDGLVVIANLTDGTRACITDYTLTLDQGDESKDLADGDELDQVGDYNVVIHYQRYKCQYAIKVLNTADLLTISDENGEPIDFKKMEPGQTLKLFASLKGKLPYKTKFAWQSDDTSIAGLETYEPSDSNVVTTRNPGGTNIKVTVTDEYGAPVEAIRPKYVRIFNESHIKDLKIIGGDIYIDKDAEHTVKLDIDPSDTTDKVTWTSSDENIMTVSEDGVVKGVAGGKAEVTASSPDGISDSRMVYVYERAKELELDPETLTVANGGFAAVTARVNSARANGEIVWTTEDKEIAGFYVKDEETGEMKVVDTVTTKLSADGSDASDAYVIVAGVADGEVKVKAETESETGGMLEKECAVTVAQSDDWVKITHNGAQISGQMLTLAIEGRVINLGADSSVDGDTFAWEVIDDGDEPVLKVNSEGRVSLLRRGTAAVRVTSETTQATDVVMIKVIISPTSIELSDTKVRIKVNETYRITAALKPDESEGKVNWSSSNDEIVTVTEDGEIKAVDEGSAIITAVLDNDPTGIATCEVEVYDDPPVVHLSETDIMLQRGTTEDLIATVTPKGAKGDLIWTSSDPTVAEVSETGAVKGLKEGTATIRADFSKEGSTPALCRVTVCEPKLTIKLSKTKFFYDGKVKFPTVTVKNGTRVLGKNLTKSNDRVLIVYSASPRRPGRYMVSVIARDWHYGSANGVYSIIIKDTKLKKLKQGKKKLTVRWKRLLKANVHGYQVRYSLKKNMKKAKYKKVKGWKNNKLVLKKLKGGKRYYVQVRSYVTFRGSTIWSKWSNKRTMKTKK